MEEDEGGVLRVTADQEWLDNMESYTKSIATIISEIKAYQKLMSEVNYFESNNETLITIKDRLVNIRTTLNTILRTMLSKLPSLIDGRFPITDCLTEEIRTQRIKLTDESIPLPANPLPGRRILIIFNTSNDTIYWGASNVTGGIGLPLKSGQPIIFNARSGCKFYATIPTGESSKNVVIMEGK